MSSVLRAAAAPPSVTHATMAAHMPITVERRTARAFVSLLTLVSSS
jgi:hypothetical protein